MDRLSKTYEDGTHTAADNLPCGENSWEYKRLLLEKLGAYEDTGLTPEEIMDGRMLTGWIPVAERLPDKPGDYWVTMRHLDGCLTTEKMFWCSGRLYKNAWKEVVVAWQVYYCPEPFVSQN